MYLFVELKSVVDAGELDLKGINFQFKTLDQLGSVALSGENRR